VELLDAAADALLVVEGDLGDRLRRSALGGEGGGAGGLVDDHLLGHAVPGAAVGAAPQPPQRLVAALLADEPGPGLAHRRSEWLQTHVRIKPDAEAPESEPTMASRHRVHKQGPSERMESAKWRKRERRLQVRTLASRNSGREAPDHLSISFLYSWSARSLPVPFAFS